MTTPEHALVGIHFAIAVGAYERFGWTLITIAGIASILPDWDGIPMLIDMQRFESGHRVWGHNFISIFVISLAIAWTQAKFHWVELIGKKLARFLPSDAQPTESKTNSALVLFLFSFAVQTLHLPCDMIVSGGKGLSDWHTKPFWPWSDQGFVWPLIPWGDIGPTIILMLGAIVLAKSSKQGSRISTATLVCLMGYLLIRGWM